jgi:hypothetical protein
MMARPMMDGWRRKNLTEDLFLQLSVDCCDTPTAGMLQWRSGRACRGVTIVTLNSSVLL